MAISLLNAGPSTVVADPSDLPYALVEPGKWEYALSVELTNFSVNELFYDDGTYSGETKWVLRYYSDETGSEELYSNEPQDALVLDFGGITATRASLPGHLLDRAVNAVSLSESATLVFPAQTAGKARDFVVRLTLTETNDVVPSVTFPADVAYETEGGDWPDLTEAGTYIVRLTEVPTASESETAWFFLQCSSAVADATPPSAGGAA